jgi:hypothetical protein
MRLLGRNARAFAVGDVLAGLQSRSLALHGDLRSIFASDGPRVEQIQIDLALGDVLGIGQARKRVFGSETCDVIGRFDGLLDGGLGEV